VDLVGLCKWLRLGIEFLIVCAALGAKITMLKLLLLAFLLVTAGQSQTVTIPWTWTQATGAGLATGFQIYRTPTAAGLCPTPTTTAYTMIGVASSGTATSYADVSSSSNLLTQGTTYCYSIVATGNGGASAFSNVVTATIPTPVPNPPVAGKPTVQ
jgi:hypothetical protein